MQTKISTSATRRLALKRKRKPRARSTTKLMAVFTPYRADIAFQLTPIAQSCRSIGSRRLDAASPNITLEQVRSILMLARSAMRDKAAFRCGCANDRSHGTLKNRIMMRLSERFFLCSLQRNYELTSRSNSSRIKVIPGPSLSRCIVGPRSQA